MRRTGAVVAILLALGGVLWLLGIPDLLRGGDDDPMLAAPDAGVPADEPSAPALVGRVGERPVPPPSAAHGLPVLGRVVEEGGHGVEGIRVAAFRTQRIGNVGIARQLVAGFRPGSQPPRAVAETRSGTRGRFRLDGLELATRYDIRALPAPPTVGASVEVVPRDHHGRLVTLGVVDGSAVRGRVVDQDGNGVRALLGAFLRGGSLTWGSSLGSFRLPETATDDEGRFLLGAVPHGTLYLTVRVPGIVMRSVLVGTPHPDELLIRLFEPDGATVSGTVRDGDGAPIEGASVSAAVFGNDVSVRQGVHGMATTDLDGAYRIEGLPPALLNHVDVTAPGFHPTHLDAGKRALAAGAIETVDLVLRRSSTLTGHVRDPKGHGLPHVDLMVRVDQPNSFAEVQAASDAQGTYRLEGLGSGWCNVVVRRDGWYLPAQAEGRVLNERPAGLRIEIGADGTETTLDIHMRPGHRITGRTISSEGDALSGIEVHAKPDTGREYALTAQYQRSPDLATSDGAGDFAFAGLAPGLRWSFAAQGPGYRGTLSMTDPLPMDGSIPPVEIVCQPTASIAGRVLDPADRPVAGVRVRLWRTLSRTQTAHDGTFALSEIAAGPCELRMYGPHGNALGDPLALELAWGETRDDVVLRAPRSLPFAGVLVDAQGAPMPFRYVVLKQPGSTARRGTGWPTDASGRFQATLWSPGEVIAEVSGVVLEGAWTAGQTDVRLVHRTDADRDLRIRFVDSEGQTVPQLDVGVVRGQSGTFTTETHEVSGGLLVLERRSLGARADLRASNPRDASGTPLNLGATTVENVQDADSDLEVVLPVARAITGTVLADDGAPLAGIRVRVGTIDPFARHPIFVTDDEGRFEVVGAPDGPIRLHVLTDAPWLPVAPLDLSSDAADLVVRLTRGADLVVRVLDPEGTPAGGVYVEVRGTIGTARFHRARKTDEKGEVTASGVPSAGTLKVKVTPPGPNAPWATVDIADAVYGDGLIVVQLEPAVEIRGVSVDQEGRPVTRGMVMAHGLGPVLAGQRATARLNGSDNVFVLGPLRPGRYRVTSMGAPGFAPARPIEVDAPADGVRLVLAPAVKLTGRILNADGQPCLVTWFDDTQPWTTSLDDEGRFSVQRLRDEVGTLYVRSESPDRCAVVFDVKPSRGPFELRLVEGHRIEGRIEGFRQLEGTGLAVTLRRDRLRVWGAVARDGTFVVRAVPPGRYALVLWHGVAELAVHEGIESGRTDLVIPMPDVPEAER